MVKVHATVDDWVKLVEENKWFLEPESYRAVETRHHELKTPKEPEPDPSTSVDGPDQT